MWDNDQMRNRLTLRRTNSSMVDDCFGACERTGSRDPPNQKFQKQMLQYKDSIMHNIMHTTIIENGSKHGLLTASGGQVTTKFECTDCVEPTGQHVP